MTTPNSPPGNSNGAVLLLFVLVLGVAAYFTFFRPAPQPEPDATPAIAGRWVSTESAYEVIELSPLGEVRHTTRGELSPLLGRYRYAGGVLQYTLDGGQRTRTVESRVTSLTGGEMTIILPWLVGVRAERSVTYWRIDTESYSVLRAQLLGRWQGTGPEGELVEYGKDDILRVALNGKEYGGIFRVVGQTLEYHLNSPNAAATSRWTVESISETAHSLVNPVNRKRADYTRVK